MIIQNGNIEFKTKSGGGIGADGYPVTPTEVWGKPVPCQYVPVKLDLQARSDGNAATQFNYKVYVAMPLPEEATEQLRITDMAGKEVGQYSVISSEELRAVQEIVIVV